MERTLSNNEVFWDYFLVIFQIMMAYKLKILCPAANGRLVFTIAIVYTVQKKQTNQKGRMQSLQRPVTEVVFRNIWVSFSRFTTALRQMWVSNEINNFDSATSPPIKSVTHKYIWLAVRKVTQIGKEHHSCKSQHVCLHPGVFIPSPLHLTWIRYNSLEDASKTIHFLDTLQR